MKKESIYTNKQPEYIYMEIPETNMVDVWINKFVEERQTQSEETGDITNFEYIYETNEFRVDKDHITEEMIAKNPMKYLDYSPADDITDEDRISALEDAVIEIMELFTTIMPTDDEYIDDEPTEDDIPTEEETPVEDYPYVEPEENTENNDEEGRPQFEEVPSEQ